MACSSNSKTRITETGKLEVIHYMNSSVKITWILELINISNKNNNTIIIIIIIII